MWGAEAELLLVVWKNLLLSPIQYFDLILNSHLWEIHNVPFDFVFD